MSIALGKDKPSVIIDSRWRQSGTTGNFEFQIDMPDNRYDSVCLISCQLPKCYTTINSDDDSFELWEDAAMVSVQIPRANYNAYEFRIFLKHALEEVSPNGLKYSVDYLENKNKYRFQAYTATSGIPTQTIKFVFPLDVVHELMGYDHQTTGTFDANGVLFSQRQVLFQFTRYITIKSDIAYNAGNSDPDANILARVPVFNTPDLSFINYSVDNIDDGSRTMYSNKANIFNFSLHDDHDNIIDFNGQNVKLILFLYRRNDYPEHAINSLRVQHLEKLEEE